MIFRKTISTSAVPLIAAGLVAAGCGLFGDDAEDTDDGGNGGGSGGTAGSAGGLTGGSVTGGVSGTGPTGGSITGGSSGSGTTGGTAGTGGATTGGAAGAGGNGGGAAAAGPFTCTMPKAANCGAINDFSTSPSQSWGSGDFSGGVSVFGAGIMRDMTTTGLHITGMVANYGHGFNLWFTSCSTLAAYGGVTFTISGTTGDTVMANTIDFQIQTNTDYPWQPRPADLKGGCTAPAGMDPYGVCIAPTLNVPLGASAQTIMWAQMMGGTPMAWNAMSSPAEVIGLQWQFPWTPTRTAYMVDVTLDNVQFTGGTGPSTACPPYMAGMGGMGGAGGASAGMAGAAGGGRGGMAGAGGAGAGGGGRGGMAGAGGT